MVRKFLLTLTIVCTLSTGGLLGMAMLIEPSPSVTYAACKATCCPETSCESDAKGCVCTCTCREKCECKKAGKGVVGVIEAIGKIIGGIF